MQKYFKVQFTFILFIIFSFGRLYCSPSDYLEKYFNNSKDLEVLELFGGLSGAKNYKITADGNDYVLRILNPQDGLQQRQNEIKAAIHAANLNIGPAIYYVDPHYQAMIMGFVKGLTVNPSVWDDKEKLKSFLQIMRQLHESTHPDFPKGWTLIERTRMQLEKLTSSEVPFPKEAVIKALKKLGKIEEVFKNEPLVPCHNDLNSLNIMIEDLTFKIIDWTDAGFGSCYQDLSGFILMNGKDAENQIEILEIYFGRPPSSRELRKFRLMKEVVVLSIFSASFSGYEAPIQDEQLRFLRGAELERLIWEKDLPSLNYFLDLHAQGKLDGNEMMIDVALCALRSFLKD